MTTPNDVPLLTYLSLPEDMIREIVSNARRNQQDLDTYLTMWIIEAWELNRFNDPPHVPPDPITSIHHCTPTEELH